MTKVHIHVFRVAKGRAEAKLEQTKGRMSIELRKTSVWSFRDRLHLWVSGEPLSSACLTVLCMFLSAHQGGVKSESSEKETGPRHRNSEPPGGASLEHHSLAC